MRRQAVRRALCGAAFILADLVLYGIYRSYFMYLPYLHDFMSYIYMTMVLLWGRSVR